MLAWAVFAASIPLAVFSAVAYRRLRMLGVTAPGPAIGLAGGVLASAALALSGLVAWTAAASTELGEPAVLRALTTLAFAAGGPGLSLRSPCWSPVRSRHWCSGRGRWPGPAS